MRTMTNKIAAGILVFLLTARPTGVLADDPVQMVEAQIQYSKERFAGFKSELSKALDQMAQAPSAETLVRINGLREKVQKEKGVLGNLQLALRDAKASQSWSAIVEDMAKNSDLISAAVTTVSYVYGAGKWIIGASNEDLYGPSWQEVEGFNAKLTAEARAIREESQALFKSLDKVKAMIESGQGDPAQLDKLGQDLAKRLGELQERKELVRKNMKLLVRIYKAEKENLPASTIFWGENHMGRYIEQVTKEINFAKLVELAWDLGEGNLVKVLVKLVKPMVKVAIGDYLGKAKGGSALTPQIMDDLTFSILFKSGSANLKGVVENKIKSKATTKVIEGVAQVAIEAEAQAMFAIANKQAYEIMKGEIAALPKGANFASDQQWLQKSTDKFVKNRAKDIEYNALNKLDKMKKAGKVLKDVWDLVLKDAVQAYMNSDIFANSIKAANEACQKWREQYRQMANDMIATEDEFVNDKWFSGGRTEPQAAPPATAVEEGESTRKYYEKMDIEEYSDELKELREAINANQPPSEFGAGDMDLDKLMSEENSLFDLVLSGKMPFSKMPFHNPVKLCAVSVYKPCQDKVMELNRAYDAKWGVGYGGVCDRYREQWRTVVNDPERSRALLEAFYSCRKQRSDAYTPEVHNPSIEVYKTCSDKFARFAENRGTRLTAVYQMLHEQHKAVIQRALQMIAPVMSWAQGNEANLKKMSDTLNALDQLPHVSIEPFPELPANPGGTRKPEEYNIAQAREAVKTMTRALSILTGLDVEILGRSLQEVDFDFDGVLGFFADNSWLYNEAVTFYGGYQVNKEAAANYYQWSNYTDASMAVYLTSPQLLDTKPVITQFYKINTANPFAYGEQYQSLLQNYFVQRKSEMELLKNFSPETAYSLYTQAIEISNSVQSAADAYQQKVAYAESAYSTGSGDLRKIIYFYDVFFQRWELTRKINPGLAATLLGKNTDEMEKIVSEFEAIMASGSKQAPLPDPDSVKRAAESYRAAIQSYGNAFNQYYDYLADFFKSREYPVFESGDLSALFAPAEGIAYRNDQISGEYKKAADTFKKIKDGTAEMKAADAAYLADVQTFHNTRAQIAQKAIQYYQNNQQKLMESLTEIKNARAAMDKVGGASLNLDHTPSPKILESIKSGAGSGSLYEELNKTEEEILKKMKKKERQDTFSNYRIINARLNSFSLDQAFGDVAVLRDQLVSGGLQVSGGLSHGQGIEKLLFSEDGGQSWKELPPNPGFNCEWVPLPGKRYQPVIKVRTEEQQDFEMPVFPNIAGIVFQDMDFHQLIVESVQKISDAYEQQNVSIFSDLISRNFLGNKVFLEEGIRFDFELFQDIHLKLFINRIERRRDLYVAEVKWDKTQTPRKTGKQQLTTGNTTLIFVLEDGKMRLQNLRGNLLFATLSPEIAQSSGLSSSIVNQIRTAHNERNPIQPGAGNTQDSGGVTSGTLTVRTGSVSSTNAPVSGYYDFSAGQQVGGSSDIEFEYNNIMFGSIQQSAQSFAAITEAPSSGYAGPITPLPVGTVIVFITTEGYYGKLQITNKTDNGTTAVLYFQYVVQTDGSRNLAAS